nr:TetR/AcrR family transcriptional regulator [Rhodococcus sp. (in: high G+C Gram-positive bacteria)]
MNVQTSVRTRLVDVAVELLEREGIAAVTVRSIAREAGLSHGAPRRYLPTLTSIHVAIAQRGLGDMFERIASATERHTDAVARISAAAREYVSFARARPEMFALMFRHDLLAGSGEGLRGTSRPMFAMVEAMLPPSDERENHIVAVQLWTAIHGIASLASTTALTVVTDVDTIVLLNRTVASIVGSGHTTSDFTEAGS